MTNDHNLPWWLVKSIQKTMDEYDGGEEDYSATALNTPPMIYSLSKKHEVEEDYSDLLISFDGTALHNQVENTLTNEDGVVVEERYFATINVPDSPSKKKFVVSGKIDLYDETTRTLWDHKKSKMYKFINTDMKDFEQQLNVNRWLMHQNGVEVEYIKIAGFPRDFDMNGSERNRNYPEIAFVPCHIPLWCFEDVEEFIRNSILEKEHALRGRTRSCTQKERWQKDSVYRIVKPGATKSTKNCNSHEEALQYVKDNNIVEAEILEKKGEAIRCDKYCKYRQFCPDPGSL